MASKQSSITSEQISVVVQGPVIGSDGQLATQQLTKQSLLSVRNHLPRAELILSTWEGSDVSELSFDTLVLNTDPGAMPYEMDRPAVNNVNRQIECTKNGVQSSSRQYVLKLRSDSVLLGTGFTTYFGRFPARSKCSILSKKVIASTRGSFIPEYRMAQSCYFPSDWFHFGLREDVLNIWDIPLAPEPETTRWLPKAPLPWYRGGPRLRYAIEQYIWVTFLRKHYCITFDSMWDQTESTIRDSECSIAGNLILITPDQAQIKSLKYPETWGFLNHCVNGCYTHTLWKALYEKHCLESTVQRYQLMRLFYKYIYSVNEASRPLRHWCRCHYGLRKFLKKS